MKTNKLVTITAACIIALCLVCLFFNFIPHSWLRFATSGIFFLFALTIFPPRNFYGPLFFFLLVVCDLILVFWDYRLIRSAYYLSHIFAVSILIFLTLRELKTIRISKVEILSILMFFGINTIILFILGESFNLYMEGNWLRSLFYVNGFLILILVLAAFLYSIRFANDVSAFLFVGVMGVTVADLLLFGILFLNSEEFKYVDIIFYSAGLFFLLLSYIEHKRLSMKRKEAKSQFKNDQATQNPAEVYR